MVNVYIQIGMSAEKYTTFVHWTEREYAVCQRLANRFKSEVRVLNDNDNRTLGVFHPHREECSDGC